MGDGRWQGREEKAGRTLNLEPCEQNNTREANTLASLNLERGKLALPRLPQQGRERARTSNSERVARSGTRRGRGRSSRSCRSEEHTSGLQSLTKLVCRL